MNKSNHRCDGFKFHFPWSVTDRGAPGIEILNKTQIDTGRVKDWIFFSIR